jgi:hypothetical protein
VLPVIAAFLLPMMLACGDDGDPLADVDRRYSDVMLALGAAERDTTRNIHNKEARRRKAEAEGRKVAFFMDKKVQAAIEAARDAPAGSSLAVRGAAYRAQMVAARAWTAEEKDDETRLAGALDEGASVEADWYSKDGRRKIVLGRNWGDVSRQAGDLDDTARHDLARSFMDHRTALAGKDLIELVKLRNTVAKRAGFDNYWLLSLDAEGLGVDEVEATIAELTAVVKPLQASERQTIAATAATAGITDDFANHEHLRRLAGVAAGRDKADAAFDADAAEERVVTAFRDMGFDTSTLQIHTGPTRVVLPGVYGFAIKPPQFNAIVMSVDERWSAWPYEALMHEIGHAVWWMNLDAQVAASPVLWQPPDPWFEGFAQFFERMVFDEGFTGRYVPDLAEADRAVVEAGRRAEVIDGIIDAIVTTRAERRLYENPDDVAGAMKLAADLRAELTGVPAPEPDEKGRVYDPALLSSLLWHYAAYSPNYLTAYMTEAQLWEGVSKGAGEPIGNPKVAPFIVGKIVRGEVGQSLADRIAAIAPGERTAPLKAYLAGQ